MTFIRSAYIIAGIAISPLLKMNGEVAIAMACAAFCIPTSITIVRLTESVSFPACESKEGSPAKSGGYAKSLVNL